MSSRLSPASRAALLTELQALLGDRCTTNATELEHHSHSESWHPAGVPDVVVYPLSTDEVSAILRAAARVGAPVVPFGAGSSLEGHVNAVEGGVSIDLVAHEPGASTQRRGSRRHRGSRHHASRAEQGARQYRRAISGSIPVRTRRSAAWRRPVPRGPPPFATERCARPCAA